MYSHFALPTRYELGVNGPIIQRVKGGKAAGQALDRRAAASLTVGRGQGMARLTKAQIDELCDAGTTEGVVSGTHWTGVPNLFVQIRPSGPSWIFRYNRKGLNRQMGLGPLSRVGYQAAIDESVRCKALLNSGFDPIEARKAQREGRPEPLNTDVPTFRAAARAYIEFASPSWRDQKAELGWARRLSRYVFPALADKPVNTVDVADVVEVIGPIWRTRAPTAKKVLAHLRQILRHAMANDWHPGPNPADLNASPKLLVLLGGPQRHQTQHFRSLDWQDVPACWSTLAGEPGVAAACLRLVMLTVVRPTVARAADWGEFDLERSMWAVPAERMKTARAHRVPLSPAAMGVVEGQGSKESGLVFIGKGSDGLLSDTAMNRVLDRLGFNAVPHGFRSSFVGWAREAGGIDREIREAVLAHSERSETIKAYERSDLIQGRRDALERWAAFITES